MKRSDHKKAQRRLKEEKKARDSDFKSEAPEMLTNAIGVAIRSLKQRQMKLTMAEMLEAKTRLTASIVPAESSDRFSRAETTLSAVCIVRS